MRVITYGTFDTFHHGHLELFRRIKLLGSELYVGISTDEFNLCKGKSVKFTYQCRKEWVANVRYVDFVFPEYSWFQKELDIKTYKIDLLVMGDDWKGKFDQLPCKVVYLPRTPNISSTDIKTISTGSQTVGATDDMVVRQASTF